MKNLHNPGRRCQMWEDENTTAAVGSRCTLDDVAEEVRLWLIVLPSLALDSQHW
jgi:hypothetical protein